MKTVCLVHIRELHMLLQLVTSNMHLSHVLFAVRVDYILVFRKNTVCRYLLQRKMELINRESSPCHEPINADSIKFEIYRVHVPIR